MGEVEEKKEGEYNHKVPIWKLMRYASRTEVFLLFVALMASLAHGVIQPLFIILFGDMLDQLSEVTNLEEMLKKVEEMALNFVYLALFASVVSFMQLSFTTQFGQSQANKIRKEYLKAILRQEMGFFDKNQSRELCARFTSDVPFIQDAVSDKLGLLFQYLSVFISGFAVSFTYSWKIGLVTLAATPAQILAIGFTAKAIMLYSDRGQKAYAKAGGIADETFAAIRTVTVFGGQKFAETRYFKALEEVLNSGIKRSYMEALGVSLSFFVAFNLVSLSLWYGSTLVKAGQLTVGDVLTSFFCVMIGSMGIGMMTPSIVSISKGCGAAYVVFEVIDRVSEIDSMSSEGKAPSSCSGKITFKDVKFRYPGRPDVQVLKGVSFQVDGGKTVAFVGQSGCGKSTTISLLEKFYVPESGSIQIDGVDVNELNTKWLRSQIGLVGQEPALFGGTVAENIALGKPDATMEEIIESSKKANAYEFISQLPEGFNTVIQPRASNLSGGQKQRIAIARALIKNPSILLLDEATSALDSKSEEIVQDALEKASKGRSTILIAHRLSTVKNADQIYVYDQGNIVEHGTHKELMRLEGKYAKLVKIQSSKDKKKHRKEKSKQRKSKDKSDKNENYHHLFKIDPERIDKTNRITLEKIKSPMKRAFKLNFSREWPYIIVGAIVAIFNGASFPAFAVVFAQVLSSLMTKRGDELQDSVNFWCLMFVIIAIVIAISNYIQTSLFLIAGEKFTNRLRQMTFASIVYHASSWYDQPLHHNSVLSATLSNEIPHINRATGKLIGATIRVLSAILVGAIIGFFSCTKLAAATIACVPLMAVGSFLRVRTIRGFSAQLRKAYERSSFIAAEAVENIRTVLSLGRQEEFLLKYEIEILKPQREAIKDARLGGLGLGYGEAINFLVIAMSFYYGSKLVADNQQCDSEGMLRAMFSVLVIGSIIGDSFHIVTDFQNANEASKTLFEYIDTKTEPSSLSIDGKKPDSCNGNVKFDKVAFCYPSRPDVAVLKEFSFDIESGKTLALVGPSGCGKSTTVGLLERLYDPQGGAITVDGINIQDLNINWLRNQIAFVSQEPILFATSIRENILYGKDQATEEEMIIAAKKANAHNFISMLPEGYDTYVGERGTQLSGGQKQRIAIARALIRDPKILLLDEATSALDTESEKLVQDALAKARTGRTTIIIAHRLSTIRDADKIVVVERGQAAEIGTHSDLMGLRGKYYDFVKIQKLEGR